MNEDKTTSTIFCTPLFMDDNDILIGEIIPTINVCTIITEPSSKYKWFKKKKKNRRRKT